MWLSYVLNRCPVFCCTVSELSVDWFTVVPRLLPLKPVSEKTSALVSNGNETSSPQYFEFYCAFCQGRTSALAQPITSANPVFPATVSVFVLTERPWSGVLQLMMSETSSQRAMASWKLLQRKLSAFVCSLHEYTEALLSWDDLCLALVSLSALKHILPEVVSEKLQDRSKSRWHSPCVIDYSKVKATKMNLGLSFSFGLITFLSFCQVVLLDCDMSQCSSCVSVSGVLSNPCHLFLCWEMSWRGGRPWQVWRIMALKCLMGLQTDTC